MQQRGIEGGTKPTEQPTGRPTWQPTGRSAGQPTGRSTRRRRVAAGVALAGGGLALLAGWQLTTGTEGEDGGKKGIPTVPVAAVKPSARLVVLAPQGRAVRPDQNVEVRVADGKLTRVSVTDPRGVAVPGTWTAPGMWTTTERLAYGTTYTVSSEAMGKDGATKRHRSAFTTLKPQQLLETDITPYGNQEVGVGMPIIVRFTEDVKNRADVERRLQVRSSKPVVGSWHWTDDDEVHYRPQRYWPAYSNVRVKLALGGVEADTGVWGEPDREVTFRVGPAMVSRVDASSLRMRVVRDGKLVKTIRVTTGKRGYTTRSGIKVVSERNRVEVMESPGLRRGQPGYYKLTVPYALRITNSGEFVHAASWSVRSQGRRRVSHGCVGMSPRNAAWLYANSRVGDIVEVVNTSRGLEPQNGWTQWNMPWAQWKAGSALATGGVVAG